VRSQVALFSSRVVSPPPLFSVSGYSHPLTPVASASSTSSLVSWPFCSHRLTTLPPTTGRNPPDLFYDRRRENSKILIRLPPPPPAHPLALPALPSFSPAPSPPNQNLQGGNLRVGGGGVRQSVAGVIDRAKDFSFLQPCATTTTPLSLPTAPLLLLQHHAPIQPCRRPRSLTALPPTVGSDHCLARLSSPTTLKL
jgi:hypothetical protein